MLSLLTAPYAPHRLMANVIMSYLNSVVTSLNENYDLVRGKYLVFNNQLVFPHIDFSQCLDNDLNGFKSFPNKF